MKRRALLFLFQFMACCSFGQQAVFHPIDSLISDSDYDGARKLISNAAAKATGETAYRLSNKLSEVLILQGMLDDAESTLQSVLQSTPPPDDFIMALTKTNLGFFYLNKARNDLAIEHLQEALDLFRKSGKDNSMEAATCLAHIALVYNSTGKYFQARENGLIALQIRQKLAGETSEALAASYNDLGLVYGQTDSDKALDYYEMARTVYERIHGKRHRKIAIASNNIGGIYRELKLYGDAINSFELSEQIWKEIYPEGHPNQALALFNLGRTYSRMGNLTSALGYFERALAMYKKYYGEKHSDIAVVVNQIGVLKKEEGKFDESLAYTQQALQANTPAFSQDALERNPSITSYYNGKVLLYSLRLKAQTLEARHFGKTLRLKDLRLALNTLYSCDSLIDNLRFSSSNENDKLELGTLANEVYEDGVRIAEAISEMTFERTRFQKVAFYFAEKSKSAVLQASIADAEAKSFAGIPSDMLEHEKSLKASIALFSQKLSQHPDIDAEQKIREDLFNANREYNAFIQHLEKDYPDYFNLKFNQVSPSIEAIQHKLNKQQAVVSYFLAEKDQRLYTFIIKQNSFRVYNSTLPSDFDRMIRGFTNSMYYSVDDLHRESSERLSALLLRGVPSLPEIIIIPSGRLGMVPFEALIWGRVKKTSTFADFPYLVKKHAISYEFSAGLLLQKSTSKSGVYKQSIFLCAPISFPIKDNLNDLPGTEREVNTIQQLFTDGTKVVTGLAANEELIKSGALSDFRYLHFATHGIVDETAPELSRIFLQSSENEDGNVYSGEIFNLQLNAELAVLSACQTGLGKFSKGEGVIGLSRALVYAGADNIMVSYWSVADESTAELMADFYRILLRQDRPNFRLALQTAKCNMINQGKFVSPYYWAPFVLIGF
ncbi:MAG: CHAT domain-containing tetratricopeptide repeat protein [Cytophagales bacterium]|nr:CHAT domain-containing tetratricopeptide repeat protein [Cytophagales bacterium]